MKDALLFLRRQGRSGHRDDEEPAVGRPVRRPRASRVGIGVTDGQTTTTGSNIFSGFQLKSPCPTLPPWAKRRPRAGRWCARRVGAAAAVRTVLAGTYLFCSQQRRWGFVVVVVVVVVVGSDNKFVVAVIIISISIIIIMLIFLLRLIMNCTPMYCCASSPVSAAVSGGQPTNNSLH